MLFISVKPVRYGYSLEVPQKKASNEHTKVIFCPQSAKKICT